MKHDARWAGLLWAAVLLAWTAVLATTEGHPALEDNSGQKDQSKVPLHPGRYGEEAVANLTAWRDGIMRRTVRFHAENPVPWGKTHHKDPVRVKWVATSRTKLFQPFVTCPPGQPLTRLKPPETMKNDAGKWMCADANLKKAPCTIYSLGSRGDYQFESDMLNTTACEIHTFDCTWNGKSLDPERHTYHKICIGTNPNKTTYKPLGDILKMLGHKRVDVLKIDIEGWEADVLQDWNEWDILPRQLLVEMHFVHVRGLGTVAEMSLLFAHMAMLGYGITGMENNRLCPRCFEVGLLRVEGPAEFVWA